MAICKGGFAYLSFRTLFIGAFFFFKVYFGFFSKRPLLLLSCFVFKANKKRDDPVTQIVSLVLSCKSICQSSSTCF